MARSFSLRKNASSRLLPRSPRICGFSAMPILPRPGARQCADRSTTGSMEPDGRASPSAEGRRSGDGGQPGLAHAFGPGILAVDREPPHERRLARDDLVQRVQACVR